MNAQLRQPVPDLLAQVQETTASMLEEARRWRVFGATDSQLQAMQVQATGLHRTCADLRAALVHPDPKR